MPCSTTGRYLRFLLSVFPFLFLALAVLGTRVRTALPPWLAVPLVTTALVAPIGWGVSQGHYLMDLGWSQAAYKTTARAVDQVTEPGSVVFAMQHSGSVRFYAGRVTLRYDYLDPAWLARAVTWMAERGHHPYALLEAWEVDAWRRRFGESSALARLDFQPIRRFQKPDGMVFYDLLAPGPDVPRLVAPVASDYECRAPAANRTFAWSAPSR